MRRTVCMPRWEIQESGAEDLAALEALYPAAFPEEDLLPLVRGLQSGTPGVLSLLAVAGHDVIGHTAFTACSIAERPGPVALLAPLAVAPAHQRQGIGSALVRAGFDRSLRSGMSHVFVLGDPAYYGRFGFAPERGVAPPYPMPEEWADAWQSVGLDGTDSPRRGTLNVPSVWRRESLWGP